MGRSWATPTRLSSGTGRTGRRSTGRCTATCTGRTSAPSSCRRSRSRERRWPSAGRLLLQFRPDVLVPEVQKVLPARRLALAEERPQPVVGGADLAQPAVGAV